MLWLCGGVKNNSRKGRPPVPPALDLEVLGGFRVTESAPDVLEAIQMRRLDMVREALSHGAATESRGQEGRTPLLLAALAGYGEIVSEILNNHPDLEARDEEGFTALMLATARVEIVSQLLRAGALVDGAGSFPKETPLMYAVCRNRPDCVEVLLKAGAKANGQNEAGSTALMTAVHWDSLGCTKLLIKAGASVDLRDARGRTALFQAVSEARESICLALIEAGANPDSIDNSGRSPRMLADSSDSAAIRKLFSGR
jgi:ankyrin repeat protein